MGLAVAVVGAVGRGRLTTALEATHAPDAMSVEAVGVTLAIAPITLGMRIGTGDRERNLVTIAEPAAAATWLGVTEADLLALPGAFLDHAGAWWATWDAAEPLAQMVAAAHPDLVMDLIEIERQHMDWMRMGGRSPSGSRTCWMMTWSRTCGNPRPRRT